MIENFLYFLYMSSANLLTDKKVFVYCMLIGKGCNQQFILNNSRENHIFPIALCTNRVTKRILDIVDIVPFVTSPLKGRFVIFLEQLFSYFQHLRGALALRGQLPSPSVQSSNTTNCHLRGEVTEETISKIVNDFFKITFFVS